MNFIKEYVTYASAMTDAPIEFHEAFALGILSAVLSPQTFLVSGSERLRPNLFVVVVGESTLARKSTSLFIARSVAADAGVYFGANESTPEAVVADLVEHPQQVMLFSEFGAFLKKVGGREYLAPLRGLLTELFDCPAFYKRTTMKASYEVIQPVLSVWGATTTEWLLEAITEDDIRGGFLPRFYFVIAGERRPPMAFPPPRDDAAHAALVNYLVELKSKCQGEIQLSPDAQKVYVEWFAEIESRPISPILVAFRGRLQRMALKLAFLDSVALAPVMTVPAAAMETAVRRIDANLNCLTDWKLEQLAFNSDAQEQNKIIRYIKAGVVEHAALMREAHLSKPRMDRAIASLVESERLNVREIARTDRRGGRPRRIYSIPENLCNLENLPPPVVAS